jgi:hydroxymethylpyrimidine pyrophosphatase-like HAD family hydrolase
VLAIGDAENDIEMLQMAGIGVAMGNAHASVQAAANHVVASNDADGVAEAVERFVLAPAAAPAVEPEVVAESES